ncbi:MAG: hypothetical protein AAGD10_21660 [Myxococcota bacterium]
MKEPMDHPPLVELELHLVGESEAETDVHLASCLMCRRRLDALREANQAYYARQDEDRLLGLEVQRGRAWLWPVAGAALAAGLLLALPSPPSETRFKGIAATLQVLRERRGAVTRGCQSLSVESGDRLRFAVSGPEGAVAQVLGRTERETQLLAELLLDGSDQVVPTESFEVPETLAATQLVLTVSGEEAARCSLSPP